MKGLFGFIAAFFAVFTLSLVAGEICGMYGLDGISTLLYIVSGVSLSGFLICVTVGFIKSAKNKNKNK